MADLIKRKNIWLCLSALYLDTELSDNDYERIANTLKASHLSLQALKEIDLWEVFPSLQANLLSVAGEWAGFDEAWLIRECTKNYHKKNGRLFRWRVRWQHVFSYKQRKLHWDNIEERFH